METATATLKLEVDASELDAAIERYALVSRADVHRMIAAAMDEQRKRLPNDIVKLRKRGYRI